MSWMGYEMNCGYFDRILSASCEEGKQKLVKIQYADEVAVGPLEMLC